jgi:hypothetical protein
MLDSTLTPDRATPMLLLMNRRVYKWKPYKVVCVMQPGVWWVFIDAIGQFPCVGSGAHIEVEGRVAATWAGRPPFSHVPHQ